MTKSDIESTVLSVLTAILKRPFPDGSDAIRSETAGWDSLKHVEIVFAVEEELGIVFPETVLGDLDRVSRIVDVAASLIAESGR